MKNKPTEQENELTLGHLKSQWNQYLKTKLK